MLFMVRNAIRMAACVASTKLLRERLHLSDMRLLGFVFALLGTGCDLSVSEGPESVCPSALAARLMRESARVRMPAHSIKVRTRGVTRSVLPVQVVREQVNGRWLAPYEATPK